MEQISVVEVFIESIEGARREIVFGLRQLILDTVPGVMESVKWNVPIFSSRFGDFCFISPHRDLVSIGFYHGAQLQDPERLLNGTDGQVRHFPVASLEDLPLRALCNLILQASTLATLN